MKDALFIPCYIEGVLIHSVQGVRSLTVALVAKPSGDA